MINLNNITQSININSFVTFWEKFSPTTKKIIKFATTLFMTITTGIAIYHLHKYSSGIEAERAKKIADAAKELAKEQQPAEPVEHAKPTEPAAPAAQAVVLPKLSFLNDQNFDLSYIKDLADNQRLELENGLYIGSVKENQPEGLGRMYYKNGDVALGTFKNGQLDKGILISDFTFNDGIFKNKKLIEGQKIIHDASYKGYFNENGKLEGKKCKIVYSNGKIEEGVFKEGILISEEVENMPWGDGTYTGQTKNRQPHGKGKHIDRKDSYDGDFIDGEFIKGRAKISRCVFLENSTFSNYMPTIATKLFSNGTKLSGNFNGKLTLTGEGVKITSNGVRNSGPFKDDLEDGLMKVKEPGLPERTARYANGAFCGYTSY